MNKKLLFGAAFLGLSSIASAQTLFEDDFSNGDAKWTINNGTPATDGDGNALPAQTNGGMFVMDPINGQGLNNYSLQLNNDYFGLDNDRYTRVSDDAQVYLNLDDNKWYLVEDDTELVDFDPEVELTGGSANIEGSKDDVFYSVANFIWTATSNFKEPTGELFPGSPNGYVNNSLSQGNQLVAYTNFWLRYWVQNSNNGVYDYDGRVIAPALQTNVYTAEITDAIDVADASQKLVLSFYQSGLQFDDNRTVEISYSSDGTNYSAWETAWTSSFENVNGAVVNAGEPSGSVTYVGDSALVGRPVYYFDGINYNVLPLNYGMDPSALKETSGDSLYFDVQAFGKTTEILAAFEEVDLQFPLNTQKIKLRFKNITSDSDFTGVGEGGKFNGEWFVDDVAVKVKAAEDVAVNFAFHGSNSSTLYSGADSVLQTNYFKQIAKNTLEDTDVVVITAEVTNNGSETTIAGDASQYFKLTVTSNGNEVYTENVNLKDGDDLIAEADTSYIINFGIPGSALTTNDNLGNLELGSEYVYKVEAVGYVGNLGTLSAVGNFYVHPTVSSKEILTSVDTVTLDIEDLFTSRLGYHSNTVRYSDVLTDQSGDVATLYNNFFIDKTAKIDSVYLGIGGYAKIGDASSLWSYTIYYGDEDSIKVDITLTPEMVGKLVAFPVKSEEIVIDENGIPNVVVTNGITVNPEVDGPLVQLSIESAEDKDGFIDYCLGGSPGFSNSSFTFAGRSYLVDKATDAGYFLGGNSYMNRLVTSDPTTTGIIGKDIEEAFETSIYPNPTSANATVTYALTEKSNVTIEVKDITGKLIISKNRGVETKGNKTFELNTENLRAGVYFYSVETANAKVTKRFSVVK